MTLSEIETTLDELVSRHNNLTVELLTTLLLAAGWEDKTIKDAVMLYRQRPPVVQNNNKQTPSSADTTPVQTDEQKEIVFYQSDGTKEKDLNAIKDEPVVKREEIALPQLQHDTSYVQNTSTLNEKEQIKVTGTQEEKLERVETKEPVLTSYNEQRKFEEATELTGERKEESDADKERSAVVQPEMPRKVETVETVHTDTVTSDTAFSHEPQSLIVEDLKATNKVPSKEIEIPDDLPLLPFESSPHVWSFSHYKKVFHGDDSSSAPEISGDAEKIVSHAPITAPIVEEPEEEMVVEKIPLTKGDESLVFLAGVMLLVIILILGYMYGNGRL